MITLPALSPGLSAQLLGEISPRLRTRAATLATEMATWQLSPGPPLRVHIGKNTVLRDGETFSCDCLLSPGCAHIAALLLAAPVAEAEALIDAAPSTISTIPTVAPLRGEPTRVVESLQPVLREIAEHGLSGLSVAGHTRLLAGVQAARTTGLYRLERELTALTAASRGLRLGQPVGRRALAEHLVAILLTCHLLRRDVADPVARGSARRAYRELSTDSGQGAGSFLPLCAEPVLTDSGYAGVSITLLSTGGELFQLSQTPPGGPAEVRRVWLGPVRLGDLHCSYADLSQHKLLITGGRAAADKRLGSGRGTRAAQGEEMSLEILSSLSLPAEFRLLSGAVVQATPGGLVIAGATGTATFSFLPAARKLGLAGLPAVLAPGVAVTVLLRAGEVVALWLDQERILPGLDRPRVPAGASISTPGALENSPLAGASRSVAGMLWPWLERIAARGAPAVLERRPELRRDLAWLQSAAAPLAAELLARLGAQPDHLPTILSLGVYLSQQE